MSNTKARSETANESPSGPDKDAAMSASGTKRTWSIGDLMSALRGKADVA
jgi:hypothetical protein